MLQRQKEIVAYLKDKVPDEIIHDMNIMLSWDSEFGRHEEPLKAMVRAGLRPLVWIAKKTIP